MDQSACQVRAEIMNLFNRPAFSYNEPAANMIGTQAGRQGKPEDRKGSCMTLEFKDLPESRLESVSEALLYHDCESCPRSGYSFFLINGEPDLEALRSAVRRAQYAYPSLISLLAVQPAGLRKLLVRRPMADPPVLKVVDDFQHDLGGRSPREVLREYFEPRYLQSMDIFTEPAANFYLFRLPDRHCALVCYSHHVAADGSTMTGIFRTLWAAYHESVTGQAPAWAHSEDLASSGRVQAPYSTIRYLLEMNREGRRLRKHPIIRFGRDCPPTSARRHMVEFALTETETKGLVVKAKKFGLTVNDYLSVACIQSVDAMLGTPPGTLSFWIPANIRSTAKDLRHANYSTAVNIDLIQAERIDPPRLAKTFLSRRQFVLTPGRPYASLRMLELLLRLAQYFPVARRRRYLKKLFSRPMTFMMSNLGILWPRRIDGKMTTESLVTHAGGLDLYDYGYNFSTDDNLGHGLVAHTYNGRFCAYFSANQQVMELEYAQRFMSLLRDRLLV